MEDLCQDSDNDLKLSHARYNLSGTCDDGSISGRIIAVENNTYTSQLIIVNLTSDIYSVTKNSIECVHDDGYSETSVGSVNITLGMPMSIKHLLNIICLTYNHNFM